MNIFYTSTCPIQAARNLCNVHVNKMIIESCQLLSAAHHVLDGPDAIKGIMKLTHTNHPSSVWVRSSSQHYNWLLEHLIELLKIFEQRSGKIHSVAMRIAFVKNLPKNIADNGFSNPPRVMDEDLQNDQTICTITAYSKLLARKYSEWTIREKPLRVEFYYDVDERFDYNTIT